MRSSSLVTGGWQFSSTLRPKAFISAMNDWV
jgi:hypothetical protein